MASEFCRTSVWYPAGYHIRLVNPASWQFYIQIPDIKIFMLIDLQMQILVSVLVVVQKRRLPGLT
jgi:hypothetical protein